jgi:hypothetical protein
MHHILFRHGFGSFFFNTHWGVASEQASTIPKATARSANSSSFHRALASGAALPDRSLLSSEAEVARFRVGSSFPACSSVSAHEVH